MQSDLDNSEPGFGSQKTTGRSLDGLHQMRRLSIRREKTAEKTGPAKVSEKLAEKRRALGRGLESLLPGPGWCLRRRLPPFRKVRGRMGHPTRRLLFLPLLLIREWTAGGARCSIRNSGNWFWISCRRWLRGRLRMGRRCFFWGSIRSIQILTRRGESYEQALTE